MLIRTHTFPFLPIQVLNTLQMWAKSSDRMTYMDVKGRMGGIEKDKTLRCGIHRFIYMCVCIYYYGYIIYTGERHMYNATQ